MNPTTPRDLVPDVLRGFALFGIALVSVAFFAMFLLELLAARHGRSSPSISRMAFVQGEGPDVVVVELVPGGSVCNGTMRPARCGRGAEARS